MDTNTYRPEREIQSDITVPFALLEGREQESLRLPPHMARAEIIRRLEELGEFDPAGAGGYFQNIEGLSAARIGARVIAAMNWLQENHGHPFVVEQLQMVALNLKNLD
jgi:hypothetical protein